MHVPFFINLLMNQKELQDLSYSISYLSNDELEVKLGEFLPPVCDCLDNPSTIRLATNIIQQVKERYQQYEVSFLIIV